MTLWSEFLPDDYAFSFELARWSPEDRGRRTATIQTTLDAPYVDVVIDNDFYFSDHTVGDSGYERRQLHDRIASQGYQYHDIVDEGVYMFKGPKGRFDIWLPPNSIARKLSLDRMLDPYEWQ